MAGRHRAAPGLPEGERISVPPRGEAAERGAVVLVQGGELALIERVRGGRIYYLFPGGGVEAGETPEQAAAREAREELGLTVAIGRLVAVVTHGASRQYHFLAEATGGTFGTGDGAEFRSPADSPEGSYRPVRLPLGSLAENDVRPKALAEAVAGGKLAGYSGILYLDD